jgi:hypothetical protein
MDGFIIGRTGGTDTSRPTEGNTYAYFSIQDLATVNIGAMTSVNLYYGSNVNGTRGTLGLKVSSEGCRAEVGILTSDDRIKENEKLIVNATETLSKLTPQIYDKYNNMDLSGSFHVESGLVAQEVYYNAPELRHLVVVGKEYDASGNDITPTPDEIDLSGVEIGSDPDYGSHGWSKTEKSALNYQGLIAYLIKSNQEMNAQYNLEKEKAATLETEVSTLKTQMTEILARLSSLESSSQNNSVTVDASDNPTAV